MGDLGSIPGWGRAPGEGKGYPLQYACLEYSMEFLQDLSSLTRDQSQGPGVMVPESEPLHSQEVPATAFI